MASLAHSLVPAALAALLFSAVQTAQAADKTEDGILMAADRLEAGIRTSNRRIDDPALEAYLREVTCKAVQGRCANLRVYAVRSPGFNAYMLPNGAMVVQSGLLLRLETEAELAAVLGHEASHHVRKHTLNRWRKAKRTTGMAAFLGTVAQIGAVATQSNSGAAAATAAGALVQLAAIYQMSAYNRKQEQEADLDGIRWMVDGGYDGAAAPAVWRKLVKEQDAVDRDGGFNLLATHPAPKKRMKYLTEAAQSLPSASDSLGKAPAAHSFAGKFAAHRETWLTDEMAGIHPARFMVVTAEQRRLGFPAGLSAYMEARVWMRHAKRGGRSERPGALASALAAFQRGDAAPDAMPPQAHREWGRAILLTKRPDLHAAQGRFNRYFELRPDAQDRGTISALMERRFARQR